MKGTRAYVKRQIEENPDTDGDVSTLDKKKAIEEFCLNKLLEKPYSEYQKFFFTDGKNYVKLREYHPYWRSTDVNRELEGIHHKRIQREALDQIKKGLIQLSEITNEFDKTYRQELIDSKELHEFVLSVMELQEHQRKHKIIKYPFALKWFYSLLKIIIETAPGPIQSHMVKAIKDFIDMANLPVDLGVKEAVPFLRPVIKEHKHADGSIRYTLQLQSIHEPSKKKLRKRN